MNTKRILFKITEKEKKTFFGKVFFLLLFLLQQTLLGTKNVTNKYEEQGYPQRMLQTSIRNRVTHKECYKQV